MRQDGPVAFARPLSELARWAAQPATVGWLCRFLSNCRQSRSEHITAALAALLRRAEAGYEVPFSQLEAAERLRAFGSVEGNRG
eukprot:310548-Prymnesium_polylepis.1